MYVVGRLGASERSRVEQLVKRESEGPARSHDWTTTREALNRWADLPTYELAVPGVGVADYCQQCAFDVVEEIDRTSRAEAGPLLSELYDLLIHSPLTDERAFDRREPIVCTRPPGATELFPWTSERSEACTR